MTREEKDERKKNGGRRTGNMGPFKDMCLNEDTDRTEREDAEYSQLCDR